MKFSIFSILLFSVLSFVFGAVPKELPKSFTKCRRSDPGFGKCLARAITDSLAVIKNGIPEFGILPIEPLVVDSLVIQQGGNSPINLKQEFKNIKLINLSKSIVSKTVMDVENLHMKSIATTPRMEFLGDYKMDGRILVLPITGKGRSNITMVGLTTKHEIIGEPIQKNGEIFLHCKEYKIKFSPKRVHMHFENLFDGNRLLGENMNNFLNSNWEVVFNELKSGYEDTFGLVFKDITNKLFSKIPINKIFLD